MQAFLDYVIKALVDRPDAVVLSQSDRNGTTVYELRVHPTDMGKIIGRQGATINAIRSLLLVGSAKQGLRCSLEVLDEEGGVRESGPGEQGAASGGEGGERSEQPPFRGGPRPFRGGSGGRGGPRRSSGPRGGGGGRGGPRGRY